MHLDENSGCTRTSTALALGDELSTSLRAPCFTDSGDGWKLGGGAGRVEDTG
jgi:hypothetical protein